MMKLQRLQNAPVLKKTVFLRAALAPYVMMSIGKPTGTCWFLCWILTFVKAALFLA